MMKTIVLLGALWATMAAPAQAQKVSPPPTHLIYVNTAPSGACAASASLQFVISGGNRGNLYGCGSGGTWAVLATPSGGSGTVTSITLAGTANQITVTGTCTVTTTGTCTFSVPSDFRLPGTINKITLTQPATGATVTLVDGKTFTVNKTLTLDGTDGVTITFPASSATIATLGLTNTFTGRQNAGGAASTAPMKVGTSLPGTCTVGDLFFKSDATAGQNIYECQATDTWTQQLNSGAGGASAALDNLSAVNINTSLLAQTGVDVGSAAKAFRDIYIFGAGTYSTTSIKLTGTPTGTRVLTLPNTTDTLVGKATTDTFTNKTFDTAGTGNSFSINGTAITAVSGTGAVCLATNSACATGGSVFTGSTASASSFSATPTFSLADVSVKSPVRFEPGTMTANVTAVTFSNKSAGAKFSIAWTQDGTGGRTVAYGASATGGCQPDYTAGATTTQFFEVAADGTTVNGTGCHTTTSILYGAEQAAPGTPPASTFVGYGDSTNHIFSYKANNSATVSNTVIPDTGASNNFLTAISPAGVISKAQPAFSNISGTATAGQLPSTLATARQISFPMGGATVTDDSTNNSTAFIQRVISTATPDSTHPNAFWTEGLFATGQYLLFNWQVGADYSSSPVAKVVYYTASATTNNVAFSVGLSCSASGGSSVKSHAFATANTSSDDAVPGTSGIEHIVSFSLTNTDSIAALSNCDVYLRRATPSGTDATGNISVKGFAIAYTALY